MTQEQNEIYRLLEQFVELCEAHGLKYWLDGGTLLGAVRHQGFIPWDDDIDVAMPEADYKKFIQLCGCLREGIVFQNEDTDERYPFLFGKICNTQIPFDTGEENGPLGVYIDIFPIFQTKNVSRKHYALFKLIQMIGYALQIKTGWAQYVPYKNSLAKTVFLFLRSLSERSLRKMREKLIRAIKCSTTGDTYCSLASGGKAAAVFWPREWCEKLEKVKFEQNTFMAPAAYHCYLTKKYGDYMELPPENERRSNHKPSD